jgi:hypothetical protein
MNTFDQRRQLRALKRDIEPRRDLWPDIAARLQPHTATTSSRRLPWASVAAVVLISLLIGTMTLRLPISSSIDGGVALQTSHWKPSDPRLTGAAIEFDAAESEIRLAMQQAPDAGFLHRIQQRTHAQQVRLERYPRSAP